MSDTSAVAQISLKQVGTCIYTFHDFVIYTSGTSAVPQFSLEHVHLCIYTIHGFEIYMSGTSAVAQTRTNLEDYTRTNTLRYLQILWFHNLHDWYEGISKYRNLHVFVRLSWCLGTYNK